jgi:hypothetical protein
MTDATVHDPTSSLSRRAVCADRSYLAQGIDSPDQPRILKAAPDPSLAREPQEVGPASPRWPVLGSAEVDVGGLGRLKVNDLKAEAIGQARGHKGAMTGLGRRFHTKQRADAMDGQ